MDWTNINQPKKKNTAKVEKFLIDGKVLISGDVT